MIRTSEVVLPGHPDKFCDRAADAIVAACCEADPRAWCQVEMAVWREQVFLTGGIVSRAPLRRSLADIVRSVGREVGYVEPNPLVADRYEVVDAVHQGREDPRPWSERAGDQCIAVGWAGYDARVDHLPPEHFLARALGDALFESCRAGRLSGQGPDGKLLVRLRENSEDWRVEHVLVSIQQRADAAFAEVCAGVADELRCAYDRLRARDRRWAARFDDVEVLVNPNGPWTLGGSLGDNGQTGRKLVMDFYGPRVPIGGGALSGKAPAHIDRAAARASREAALHAVRTGARECKVTLAYAPNRDLPLDVAYEMEGRGERLEEGWFAYSAVRGRPPRGVGGSAAGRRVYGRAKLSALPNA